MFWHSHVQRYCFHCMAFQCLGEENTDADKTKGRSMSARSECTKGMPNVPVAQTSIAEGLGQNGI